jgi:hypothetical protein
VPEVRASEEDVRASIWLMLLLGLSTELLLLLGRDGQGANPRSSLLRSSSKRGGVAGRTLTSLGSNLG